MPLRLRGRARERAAAAHASYLARCGADAAQERADLARIGREIAEGKRPHSGHAMEYCIMAGIALVWLHLAFGAVRGW